jgi:oxygen-independent coproporphyrinogen-3 oxidase
LVADTETLSPEERAREMAILGLRMTAGVSMSDFETRTGFNLRDLGGEAFDRYLDDGLLEIVAGRLRLTRDGRFLADSVIVDFL